MRFSDAHPAFNALYYFKYKWNVGSYPGITDAKTQYVYRLMYMAEGESGLSVDGQNVRLRAGDVLYLLPGTVYRILPYERDFSMYNLFFSFSADSAKQEEGCLFTEEYQSELCEAQVYFSDAPFFNRYGIAENVDCRAVFSSLAALVRNDALYTFHANASLSYLLSLLLRQRTSAQTSHAAALPILAYIRENPDGDLSSDALARRFLYHKNYVNHLVKSSTGKTLSRYIQGVKIEYAKSLLSEGGTSLTELALMLGYYDYSHFYKAFVAETGASPSAFLARRAQRIGD